MEKRSKGKERGWKANKTRWKLHERKLWIGRLHFDIPKSKDPFTVLVIHKDPVSYPHLRCYEFFFLTYEFARQLRPFLQLIVFKLVIERVRMNIFLSKFQTSL